MATDCASATSTLKPRADSHVEIIEIRSPRDRDASGYLGHSSPRRPDEAVMQQLQPLGNHVQGRVLVWDVPNETHGRHHDPR